MARATDRAEIGYSTIEVQSIRVWVSGSGNLSLRLTFQINASASQTDVMR